VNEAVNRHSGYIASQTLATKVELTVTFSENAKDIEIEELTVKVEVRKN
jgi:hypothetical protein